MATLSQVYFNLGLGAIVTTACFIGFGIAVRCEANKNLTPRAWARPIGVIKNCLSPPYGLSWMRWAMSLRYIDLLAGIPGTGTRMKGWSGPTLRTNLDGIVLLRYHTLQFKVSILATVLCMVLLLPLYYTVQCDPWRSSPDVCVAHSKNTDFEQLTIANVVPHYSSDIVFLNGSSVTNTPNNSYYNETLFGNLDIIKSVNWQWQWGITERYLATTAVIFLITIYTCYLLWHEWIECLALRRVYYLESEYYEERLDELDDISTNSDPEDPFQKIRPPFLPHPEMRETIPNVSLHSALYQLPNNLDSNFDDTSGKSLLERQLDAAVEFFDQCIPNQSGFTSSVAAITMVPDAKKAAKVWGKWYACGTKMRRLRYIKAHLETRLQMQRDGELGLHDFVVAAPVNAAKATIEHMKEFTTEGIEAIKGLGHRQRGIHEEEEEHQEEESARRMQVTKGLDDSAAFMSCREDEFFDAKSNADSNDDLLENGGMDEEKKNDDNIDAETVLNDVDTKKEYSMSSFSSSTRSNKTTEKSVKAESNITDSQADVALVDLEAGQSGTSTNHDLEAGQSGTSTRRSSLENAGSFFGESSTILVEDAGSEHAAADDIIETISDDEDEDEKKQNDTPTTINGESCVPGFKEGTKDRFKYEEFDPETFAKWIGYSEETELDQLIDTLDIEQLSVYAREMSQSASNPCVYGFGFKSLRLSSIEQLEVMLEDAWSSVREANAVLLLARADMFKEERPNRNTDIDKKEDTDKKNDDANVPGEEENDIVKDETKSVTSSSIKREDEIEDSIILPDSAKKQNVADEEDVPIPSNIEESNFKRSNGLRQRGKRGRVRSTRAKYDSAQRLVKEINAISKPTTDSGEETAGCCHEALLSCGATKTGRNLTTVLDHPSYCVVTFTSRQAALAARQCLADGKGTKAWKQVQNIPMHPLADAPPRNICFCRGCCRPVTLTIPNREKRTRRMLSWIFYVIFCCVYTIPLSLVSQILSPTWLAARYPDNETFQDPDNFFYKALAGISSGLIYSLFFSILPQIFKALAFSEGSSSSKVKAEENAMRFYWYFMLVTAFTGTSLVQMLVDGILQGNLGGEFRDILGTVAASIVTQQAPVWLNWIIVRCCITLPMNYLLQIMTFVYGWLRLNWLNRVMRGGGPGGPPPYRIYIDSGVVFMSLTSLAPACPIIAPAAMLYYIMFIPILRWLHIFVYRPFYDGGGNRLPVIHEILISSLILSQILLGALLLLKQSFVFGMCIGLMVVPTYLFSVWTKEKFQRSYEDAGLWQTSKLDGLSNKETMQDREKYRRWLVDCHKASYVPICLSGGEDFLTSQPAVVVPVQREIEQKSGKRSPRRGLEKQAAQKGAIYRRYMES